MFFSDRNDCPPRVAGASLVMHRLGVRAPMQMLWFVGAEVDRARLDRFADEVAAGPLGVRWVPPRAPGARPTWAASTVRPVVEIDDGVPVGAELAWADDALSRLDEDDLLRGAGWRLAAARVDDGTTVVSLAVSHTVADGQGVVAAADAAARGDHTHSVAPAARPGFGADVVDAVTTGAVENARVAAARVAQLLSVREPVTLVRTAAGLLGRGHATAEIAPPATTVVVVSTTALQDVADRHGGTATGLSVAIVANIARATAGVSDGPFAVGMPVSHRAAGDATTGMQAEVTTVRLPARTGRHTDLRDIRRRSKAAYLDARSGIGGLTGAGAVLSSVGDIPDAAADVFGTPATVVPRAQAHRIPLGFPVGADRLAVLRTFTGTSTAFTVTGATVSTDHIEAEFDAWGIPVLRRWSTTAAGVPAAR